MNFEYIKQSFTYANIKEYVANKNYVIGKVNKFLFTAYLCNDYFIAQGKVPLNIAQKLYNDPIGKDIRVNGYCTHPKPEGVQINWYLHNKQIYSLDALEEAKGCIGATKVFAQSFIDNNLFSDNPVSLGAEGFIELYHIDSQLALRVFTDTISTL